ncbi:hypothetical protein AGMMS49579_05400 [Spirochaetia bacterium]|nr:hypothetical protein AGMMS49579_05400 [Spirochaetia bacterium]
MVKFKMIRYNNKEYPPNIPCNINEVAGNFDKPEMTQNGRYSLHTEYSFGKRKFDSTFLNELNEIKSANKNGIPQLWKSKAWAKEFVMFIERFLENSVAPEIIEIHPPFIDYCKTINDFLEIYGEFEKLILEKYADVNLFIENRCGTNYGKKFLISNSDDVVNLCEQLSKKNYRLQMVLDYPQLFSGESLSSDKLDKNNITEIMIKVKSCKKYFGGIHLWGKKKTNERWCAHNGDLNTLFNMDNERKELFLKLLYETFDDDISRYMVLEVNSDTSDLKSIAGDLETHEFKFI